MKLEAAAAIGGPVYRLQPAGYRGNLSLGLGHGHARLEKRETLHPGLTVIFQLVSAGLEGLFDRRRIPELERIADEGAVETSGATPMIVY